MTTTLFDIVYRALVELGAVHEFDAAAGGTTTSTVLNTGQASQFPNDYFNDKSYPGTIMIPETTDNASPQGRFAVVTDYVQSTKTVTHAALAAATDESDVVALADPLYPLFQVITQVNAALREWGKVPTVDTSSLSVADNQTEYTLPAANIDLREVYIQGMTDDSDDNLWRPVDYWRVDRSTSGTGNADVLIFAGQPPSGRALKLIYYAPHPRVQAATEQINEHVDEEWLQLATARNMLRWRIHEKGISNDPRLNDQIALLNERIQEHGPYVGLRQPHYQGRTWRTKNVMRG